MAYSLNKPHPEHIPSIGRTHIGNTPTWPARPLYGTTLRCSCGWRGEKGGDPGWARSRGKVANEAPSKGGRKIAQDRYIEHLADVVAPSE